MDDQESGKTGKILQLPDQSKSIRVGILAEAISKLVDKDVDLSLFLDEGIFATKTDEAYPRTVLLKAIIYSYANGKQDPEDIAKLCRECLFFIKLANGRRPTVSFVGKFIDNFFIEIKIVYKEVMFTCWKYGLTDKKDKPKNNISYFKLK